jgi:hypothetical protein
MVLRSFGVQGGAQVLREDAWSATGTKSPIVHAQCMDVTTHKVPIECVGDGRIDDHSADQVDVALPSGRVVRTRALDGYWSVTVRDDASGRWIARPGQTFKASPVS